MHDAFRHTKRLFGHVRLNLVADEADLHMFGLRMHITRRGHVAQRVEFLYPSALHGSVQGALLPGLEEVIEQHRIAHNTRSGSGWMLCILLQKKVFCYPAWKKSCSNREPVTIPARCIDASRGSQDSFPDRLKNYFGTFLVGLLVVFWLVWGFISAHLTVKSA